MFRLFELLFVVFALADAAPQPFVNWFSKDTQPNNVFRYVVNGSLSYQDAVDVCSGNGGQLYTEFLNSGLALYKVPTLFEEAKEIWYGVDIAIKFECAPEELGMSFCTQEVTRPALAQALCESYSSTTTPSYPTVNQQFVGYRILSHTVGDIATAEPTTETPVRSVEDIMESLRQGRDRAIARVRAYEGQFAMSSAFPPTDDVSTTTASNLPRSLEDIMESLRRGRDRAQARVDAYGGRVVKTTPPPDYSLVNALNETSARVDRLEEVVQEVKHSLGVVDNRVDAAEPLIVQNREHISEIIRVLAMISDSRTE